MEITQKYITICLKKMNIKIIDNFLNQKDLEEITSVKLKSINSHEVKVYHNKYQKSRNQNDCITSEFLKIAKIITIKQ